MRKKILISAVASIFLTTNLIANEAKSVDDRLKALEEMVKTLKNENDALKNRVEDSETEEILDEVEDRLDKVETMALVDKVNFGVGFETTLNNFKGEFGNGNEYDDNGIWSSKFMLNMNSDISDNLKFNGRLSMYKFWANSIPTMFNSIDSMQGRKPSDSKLYVERAYVDWKISDGEVPVILTIGRQPSSDGPSHQFRNNTVRKATYSALAFDGAADGVVATFNLEKTTGVAGTALRVAYGKGFQDSNPTNFIGESSGILNDTNFYGLFLDSSIPSLGDNLLQTYAVFAKDMIASNTDANDLNNKNIGDLNIYGAMAEFNNISNSGLDFFIQASYSDAKPNGSIYYMDMNMDGQPEPYGLLTMMEGDTESKSGHAIWSGVRYTIPAWVKPKIGFEYNRGSKNWFSMTQGSSDLIDKLATRGSAYEAYYIHPINRFAHLRFGATHIKYDYSGSGWHIGMPMKIENNIFTGGQLNQLTNYYLMFNLLY